MNLVCRELVRHNQVENRFCNVTCRDQIHTLICECNFHPVSIIGHMEGQPLNPGIWDYKCSKPSICVDKAFLIEG